MKKRMTAALLGCLLILAQACGDDSDHGGAGPEPAASFPTDSGTGYLYDAGPMKIVELNGTYYDMGRQYGHLLRDPIQGLFQRLDAKLNLADGFLPSVFRAIYEGYIDSRQQALLQGLAAGSGLTREQAALLNVSILFVYFGECSVFSAWDGMTADGYTITGRNWDIPAEGFPAVFRGSTVVAVLNPAGEFHDGHEDNSVALIGPAGWFLGLTVLNEKGLYFEYNNGTLSIPLDYNLEFILSALGGRVTEGLTQNFRAALDDDDRDEVDRYFTANRVLVASLVQVADETEAWHYERSLYEPSRKVQSPSGGDYLYDNPAGTDIFTNHFFFTDWEHQRFLYTSLENDSPSKTFRRLAGMQDLARSYGAPMTVETVEAIMETPIQEGGPLVNRGTQETMPDILDVTNYAAVTDIHDRVFYVYPANEDSGSGWITIDLKKYFHP